MACSGRRERAQRPRSSRRAPINDHVRRIGTARSQLDCGLPETRGSPYLHICEFKAWLSGRVGDNTVLHRIESYVASRSPCASSVRSGEAVRRIPTERENTKKSWISSAYIWFTTNALDQISRLLFMRT